MSYDDVIDNFMAWNPEVHLNNNIIHDVCASPSSSSQVDPK